MPNSSSLLSTMHFRKLDKWYVEYYLNSRELTSKYEMVKLGTLITPVKRRIKKKDYNGVLPVVSKIGLTVAPAAINTSCGIEHIRIIFAFLSKYSRTTWRFLLFNTPSGKTIPMRPPFFRSRKQRSINKTSVRVEEEPKSYKESNDSPILSSTCFSSRGEELS